MKKCTLCKIVTLLGGIGALNWGLVAILNLDLVSTLLGTIPIAAKVVYILVGISGLMLLVSLVRNCPACNK